jgi:predicted alpha/beta hydrolase family esterase
VSDRFLILHGWQGSGPDHWQTWLAGRLGKSASYPMLPKPDAPRLDDWLDVLHRELDAVSVVICHSLSCMLWLHHAQQANGGNVERVLLVAPPSESVRIEDIEDFFPVAAGPDDVARAAASTRLVYAENDPYCPEGAGAVYGAPLGIGSELIAGAGHINPDAGYGPWPALERWCRDGGGPLNG